MGHISRNIQRVFTVGLLGVMLSITRDSMSSRPKHPYRYSDLDIPVSLVLGSVQTPEFSVKKTQWYWIMVQVERPLPFMQMVCMMAVTSSPLQLKDCSSNDPLLLAEWAVLDEGNPVASGISTTHGGGAFTEQNIFKFLGKFPASVGRKYVLKVRFAKDGTQLNVANPHLIVTKIGYE